MLHILGWTDQLAVIRPDDMTIYKKHSVLFNLIAEKSTKHQITEKLIIQQQKVNIVGCY